MGREEGFDLARASGAQARDGRPPAAAARNPNGQVGQGAQAVGPDGCGDTSGQPLLDAVRHLGRGHLEVPQCLDGSEHLACSLQALGCGMFDQRSEILAVPGACAAAELEADLAEDRARRPAARLGLPEVLGNGRARVQACVLGAQRRKGGAAGEVLQRLRGRRVLATFHVASLGDRHAYCDKKNYLYSTPGLWCRFDREPGTSKSKPVKSTAAERDRQFLRRVKTRWWRGRPACRSPGVQVCLQWDRRNCRRS